MPFCMQVIIFIGMLWFTFKVCPAYKHTLEGRCCDRDFWWHAFPA